MNCNEAREILSESYDSPVDPALLFEAHAHCRECASCAGFERSWQTYLSVGLPRPPAGLADRVMSAVHAEVSASAATVADTAADGPAAADAAGHSRPQSDKKGLPLLMSKARDPRNRRAVATWGSVAAALLILVGVGGFAGSRMILGNAQRSDSAPATSRTYNFDGTTEERKSALDMRTDTGAAAPEKKDTGSPDGLKSMSYGLKDMGSAFSSASKGQKAKKAEKPDLITIDGAVYRLDSKVNQVSAPDLGEVGKTRSALGKVGPARERIVLGTPGISRVYIQASKSEVFVFVPVARMYAGRSYVLESAPITRFGQWPTLPKRFKKPTSPSGTPTFAEVDADALSVRVFSESGAGPESGIAIAPYPPASDPLAGCPEWTWWAPPKNPQ